MITITQMYQLLYKSSLSAAPISMSVTASCPLNLLLVPQNRPSSLPALSTRAPQPSPCIYSSLFCSTSPLTDSPSELFHFLWLTSKTYFHSGL